MRDLLSSLLTKEQIGEIALNFFRKEQSSEKSKNMFFVCFYTFSKLFTLIMPKSESLKSLFAQSRFFKGLIAHGRSILKSGLSDPLRLLFTKEQPEQFAQITHTVPKELP